MTSTCQQIVSLSSFEQAFSQLSDVDATQSEHLRSALERSTEKTHQGISESRDNPDRLRYWLLREEVEVKAHTSSYLLYSEMTATWEANLWRFALNVTDQFFNVVADALDDYFEVKQRLMLEQCESQSVWYSSISDSSKKLLTPFNYAKQALDAGKKKLGVEVPIRDGDLFDTRGIVEGALASHLDEGQVTRDVTTILEQASARVEEAWRKEIEAQAPNLEALKAFSAQQVGGGTSTVAFEFGIAEKTLAMGMAGGLVGTFGLAAGWHTLTYAMVHVFPPVAIFSLLAATGLAVITKGKTLQNRKKQITEAVNQYHRHLLLHIDTQKLNDLGGKTMREAMSDRSRQILNDTMDSWQTSIFGKLRAEHYRVLIAATAAHLRLIGSALSDLGQGTQTTVPP